MLGDLFGWRRVFFFLAALFALATVALVIEFLRNPITRAGHVTATRSRGFIVDNLTVLRSPWARAVIAMGFIESLFMFGGFAYVGADLHLRFGVNFAVVGLFVGAFAVGGLIYSLSVRWLVERLGQIGLVTGGGIMLALAYATIAFAPHAYFAPFAITGIGLGYYMLHNTLQTNATQMTPEARATAVGIFSAALYFGQTLGVAINAPIFDRFQRGASVLDFRCGPARARPVACTCAEAAPRARTIKPTPLIPAEAGIQRRTQAIEETPWTPAFAGVSGMWDVPYGLPRETRSISARTIRSTIPGRLSSSHDLSIGRSISRTRSSSVRAFCPITVWASVLNALSTAFTVSVEINPRSGTGGAGSDLFANTTSGLASMVRKLGAGPGGGVCDVIASVRSNTSGASGDAVVFGAAFGGPSSSASMASISSWLLAAAAGVADLGAGGAADLAGGAGGVAGAAAAGCLAGGAVSGALAGLASSSAMIRRMEARISSIDGSWAFAVCVIP